MNLKFIYIVLCVTFLCACKQNNEITPITKEVVWMSENLNVSTFRNGDTIKEVKSNQEWLNAKDLKEAAWCYYNFDTINGLKYGKIYNWYALTDSRNIAPVGYRLPNDSDWMSLINKYGGLEKAGYKMKSINGWKNSGNGNNESLFNGTPGGMFNGYSCQSITSSCFWWSITYDSTNNLVHGFALDYSSNNINSVGMQDKGYGCYIRCIKD